MARRRKLTQAEAEQLFPDPVEIKVKSDTGNDGLPPAEPLPMGLPEVVGVLPDGTYSFEAGENYVIQTSQEVDALMRAACDGRTGKHWESDEDASTRSHAVPGAPHHVQLALSDGERAAGVPLCVLEDLTFAQDPDFNFALLYISRLLAPPAPLAPRQFASDWIDLDDVMSKIGWDPRSTKERAEMRGRVWRYILFGARASIVGQRSGRYVDKRTGEEIETVIDAPAWAVTDKQRAANPAL